MRPGPIYGSGTAGITKTGDGLLVLSATNTYNGTTTVSNAWHSLVASNDTVGIKHGLMTTIQDLGRYGYAHLGVRPQGLPTRLPFGSPTACSATKRTRQRWR